MLNLINKCEVDIYFIFIMSKGDCVEGMNKN